MPNDKLEELKRSLEKHNLHDIVYLLQDEGEAGKVLASFLEDNIIEEQETRLDRLHDAAKAASKAINEAEFVWGSSEPFAVTVKLPLSCSVHYDLHRSKSKHLSSYLRASYSTVSDDVYKMINDNWDSSEWNEIINKIAMEHIPEDMLPLSNDEMEEYMFNIRATKDLNIEDTEMTIQYK